LTFVQLRLLKAGRNWIRIGCGLGFGAGPEGRLVVRSGHCREKAERNRFKRTFA